MRPRVRERCQRMIRSLGLSPPPRSVVLSLRVKKTDCNLECIYLKSQTKETHYQPTLTQIRQTPYAISRRICASLSSFIFSSSAHSPPESSESSSLSQRCTSALQPAFCWRSCKCIASWQKTSLSAVLCAMRDLRRRRPRCTEHSVSFSEGRYSKKEVSRRCPP